MSLFDNSTRLCDTIINSIFSVGLCGYGDDLRENYVNDTPDLVEFVDWVVYYDVSTEGILEILRVYISKWFFIVVVIYFDIIMHSVCSRCSIVVSYNDI